MNHRFRTVLIGYGKIASSYAHDKKTKKFYKYSTHSEVLAAHPDFELGAVVDIDQEVLEIAKNEHEGIYASESLEEIQDLYSPEIAIIATPPEVRLQIVEKLPHLKGVIIEKPLALNMRDGIQLVETCESREIKVQVNLWRRGDDIYREFSSGRLRELVGEVQAVFATYGNGIYNNGTHLIDFIRMLAGEVAFVQAFSQTDLGKNRLDKDLGFTLILESGSPVSIQPLSFPIYREISVDIWGSGGRLFIGNEGLTNIHYPVAPNRALTGTFEILHDNPNLIKPSVSQALYNMYQNLSDSICKGVKLYSTGRSSVANANIIDAIHSSYKKNGALVSV